MEDQQGRSTLVDVGAGEDSQFRFVEKRDHCFTPGGDASARVGRATAPGAERFFENEVTFLA
jgi:hypothetical protein